jgi:glycosyltransferase involved in cell wall biosynthesis
VPEISVIIPTYQHGDTIATCLDSVFNQTFKDIEVIVVNDGSTDNTEEVLKSYLNRIIYKKNINAGSSASAQVARNTGFVLSHGKFVVFVDADLILKPEFLQTLYNTLKANPKAAYAYCGFRFGFARFKGLVWNEERLRKLNYIHTSALIRREAFIGFDESVKKLQDWDMWLSMLEQGKNGVAVNKILFSAKQRKIGMSWWLPKIFYSSFFAALGIRPKSLIRYNHAAAIIAQKHGLDLTPHDACEKWLWTVFLGIFAVSAASFGHPWIGTIASLVIIGLTLIASLNQLIYGVGVLLGELIFGSLAGKTLALSFFSFSLPLRIALFAVVGAVWLVRVLQGGVRKPQKNIIVGVGILLIMVGWGMANGLLHGIAFKAVFSDANAYFALPLIWFFVSAVKDERDQAWLKSILKHGVIALSIITIAALYFFSHKFLNSAGVFAYKWLRDSRIAEITALDNGTYRIFIQSQIFCLFAFVMVALRRGHDPSLKNGQMKGHVPFASWTWGILPASALVISMSRSFALGFIAAGITWLVLHISSSRGAARLGISTSQNQLQDSSPWTERPYRLGMTVGKIAIFAVTGLIIFLVALKLPFPEQRNQKSFQEMLISKNVSERDAAITSRWSLLGELNEKIFQSPVWGSGFGTTVTYQSSDPRIISTTGGTYTTAAFEWNYHDILVKMGLLSLLAYGYLLVAIFIVLWRADQRERRWLVPAFFALIVLNAVSPFLNHPLGIGYLALLLALAERKRGEPAPVAVSELVKSPTRAMATAPGLAMSTPFRHPEQSEGSQSL